jgi:hypothetical protein
MEQENVNREKVVAANDRTTFMSDLQKCMEYLEDQGYTDQFRVDHKYLESTGPDPKKYEPGDIKAVNFYRFEGITDPDDMSILYAIETVDGKKGTLVDAYGYNSDEDTGAFMKQVDISKQVANLWDK